MNVAPVGRPEHTNIQKHGGHIIEDEGKGVSVTSQFQSVDGLPDYQEQDSHEKKNRILQTEADQKEGNPRKVRFHLTKNCSWRAAHQAIKILLPALPHLPERTIHAH